MLPAPIPPRPPIPPAPVKVGDDFGRERQLRDFRRANNLCFRCGDRFSRDHQCKRQGAQLLTIQVGEFGELLTDDVVHALELMDGPEAVVAQCCMLSAQALTGTESPACLRLPARVQDQAMMLLLDSGSSHSFVSSSLVDRL
jgi:hypothetical protein